MDEQGAAGVLDFANDGGRASALRREKDLGQGDGGRRGGVQGPMGRQKKGHQKGSKEGEGGDGRMGAHGWMELEVSEGAMGGEACARGAGLMRWLAEVATL